MVATLAALLTLALADQKPLVCAVMNDNPVNGKAAGFEFAGAKYPLCCGGCPTSFKADPTKYAKASAEAGNTVGLFLFDPMTGVRIDTNKATISTDYKGLRYFFTSDDEKKSFDAKPDQFTVTPAKESLVSATDSVALVDYGSAAGYVDYSDVRYYADTTKAFTDLKAGVADASKNPSLKITTPSVIMGRNNFPKN